MERRQHPRYSIILKAVQANGAAHVLSPSGLARVVNISRGGLALHSSEKFETGTRLTINLHSETARTGPLEVQVLHAQEQNNGTWLMGAQFVSELSDDVLRTLVGDEPR